MEIPASVPVSRPVPTASASAPVSSRHQPPIIVVSPIVADSSPDERGANLNTSVDSTHDSGQQVTSGLRARLGTALRALHKNTGPLPPLQSAIGTLIDCVDVLEVGGPKS